MTLSELKGRPIVCPDCGPSNDIASFRVISGGKNLTRKLTKTSQGIEVTLDNDEFDSLQCVACGYGGVVADFLTMVFVDERGTEF